MTRARRARREVGQDMCYGGNTLYRSYTARTRRGAKSTECRWNGLEKAAPLSLALQYQCCP